MGEQVAETPSSGNKPCGTLERFRESVCDARELLDFAISEWPAILQRQRKSTVAVDESLIKQIEEAELVATGESPLTTDQRLAFEEAYFKLSSLLAPITVRSVRATSDEYARKYEQSPRCSARRWARKLWAWTLALAVIAVVGEVGWGQPGATATKVVDVWSFLLKFAGYVPAFAHGGVGACAYLLRSCVGYISAREFDPAYKAEYTNRIFLGAISGGVAYYLLKGVAPVEGWSPMLKEVGPSLFGFLAGFFNEALFTFLGRLADAVFPGVTLTVSQQVSPPAPGGFVRGVSLDKLVEALKATEDPAERKIITSLIERLSKTAS